MEYLKAFGAGLVSTLVVHQGLLALLHAGGMTPREAYAMAPVPPFGVPQVLSLAFWGGLWGIVLWAVIRGRRHAVGYWRSALELGAFAPTFVALFVVLPLKGQPIAGGWDVALIVGALLLNGAWGLGVAWLMRLLVVDR